MRQIWVDEEFVKRLNKIKAQRILNGYKSEGIQKLTTRMLSTKSFKQLEKELVEEMTDNFGLRFD